MSRTIVAIPPSHRGVLKADSPYCHRRYYFVLFSITILCYALTISGCTFYGKNARGFGPVHDTPTPEASSENPPATKGILYISCSGNNSILKFKPFADLNGDIAPYQPPLQGNLTGLSQPLHLSLDLAEDRLYVANFGASSILVFDKISTLSGNIPPDRSITGPNTQLSGPVSVALDPGRDLLYVADAGTNKLLIFEPASTVNGDIAPVRTIGGPNSDLTDLSGIYLQPDSDRLFVATSGSQASIKIFEDASNLNGDPFPDRTISGGATRLRSPSYLLVDSDDNLYVIDTKAILRFNGASTITGDVPPTAIIEGDNTGLSSPAQAALDSHSDTLYVVNTTTSSTVIFSDISISEGNIFPSRTLNGSNTNLNVPQGIALDPNR